MQLADDGDIGNLLVAELAVRAVDLGKDIACVDEQNAVIGLALVEEPQGRRQRDRVEHIAGHGEHAVDQVGLDQRLAYIRLGVARVAGAVGHDQRGATLGVERGGKQAYPQVVGVGNGFLPGFGLLEFGLVARDAEGVEARVFFHGGYGDVVHVERRVGHDVIELAQAAVRVFGVGVGLYHAAMQAVDGQVHLGQLDGFQRLFLAVDVNAVFRLGLGQYVLPVSGDEFGGLYKHAARAAGRVEHLAAVGLDDFHHEFDHRARRKKFAAALAFADGKVGQEVFIDLAKKVAPRVQRNVGEDFQQALGQTLVLGGPRQAEIFILRQHAGQLGFVLFDRLHGLLQRLGDVVLLRQRQQVAIPGMVGQVEAAMLDGDVRQRLFTAAALELLVLGQDGGFVLAVFVVGELQKDQTQHRGGIFAGLQVGVGTQAVGGAPEVGFELF